MTLSRHDAGSGRHAFMRVVEITACEPSRNDSVGSGLRLLGFALLVAASMTAGAASNDTTRVSTGVPGLPTVANGSSGILPQALTDDAAWMVFTSSASTLVAGDTNGFDDVFVYNRVTGSLRRTSVSADGQQGNGASQRAVISRNGGRVAFESRATNLAAGDVNGTSDVFVYDVAFASVTIASRASGEYGALGNDTSDNPAISQTGSIVAFDSWATNLVVGDENNESDVFLREQYQSTYTTTLISRASGPAGEQGNGSSRFPAISATGRFIAYVSDATNLVPDDTNGYADIFVYDRQGQTTTLVSRASGPTGAQGNDLSDWPVISADGRYVAFASYASNLVDGDLNGGIDVFVHDRQTGTTSLVSRATGANGAPGNGTAFEPSISANGRYVAFVAWANNLAVGDPDWGVHVYVRDLQALTTVRVSRASGAGGSPANDLSGGPSLGADGRYVAFVSRASNLAADDTNGYQDVFLRDQQLQVTTLVSTAVGRLSSQANADSAEVSLSDDGRYVAFSSYASNLVAEDANGGTRDVFFQDRRSGVTELVSRASGALGLQCQVDSTTPAISLDGRYVVFQSNAENLAGTGPYSSINVFIRDRESATTELVSRASGPGGDPGSFNSYDAAISGDARYVAFASGADNFVPGDTYGADVFVRDRVTHTTTLVSRASGGAGEQGNAGSGLPAISANGRFVAFSSSASNLVPGDTNGVDDIFVRDLQGQTTELVSRPSGASGLLANGNSWASAISADGRFVAYESEASNLVDGDANGLSDIFVFDRNTQTTTLVSRASGADGEQGNGASYFRPGISADGRLVAFTSWATNLDPDAAAMPTVHAYVRDRHAQTTRVVSRASGAAGAVGNDVSLRPAISADGTVVAFESDASNLVAGDTNGRMDVFARERADATLRLVALPDINFDGVEDIAVLRMGPTRAEVRSGANGGLLTVVEFLDSSMRPEAAAALPDSDSNGVPEIAVLAERSSDGRGVVEMRNVTGVAAARQVWFAAGQTPVALAVIAGDADDNGVAEIAVLSARNSDGRGLVEIKNAFGATSPTSIWVGAGLTPRDLEIVEDADANGVPEVAVLSSRDSDGRIVVEVKNAVGATNPTSVWFMAGNTAIDLAVVPDKDGNAVQEVAVLSSRNSDGRIVVEVKNAAGATNPTAVWFAAGHGGLAVKPVADSDGNGVPELAVLSRRDSDGRVVVEVKNAAGATNPRSLWYPAGYTARDAGILPDVDGNGIDEAAVLLFRDSDGRIVVQSRNAAGTQAPRDHWFSP